MGDMNDLTLDKQDNSTQLDELTRLTLVELRTILNLPIDPEHLKPGNKHWRQALETAKLKVSVSDRILNTQVRVDETRLKARTVSKIPQLLQELLELKAKRKAEGEGRLIEARAIEAKPEVSNFTD
jgi:hypothetical protein